jgi:hypothetical protein
LTEYTIYIYDRSTQKYTLAGYSKAGSTAEAVEAFRVKENWKNTTNNCSLIARYPICR